MRFRFSPSVTDRYPNWLLPFILGPIKVTAILGMTGAIRLKGADACEATGGKYMTGPGEVRGCIKKEAIEPPQ